MIVAFKHPHNEGCITGVITGPGFDSGYLLVDTYEVDASIASFETLDEAFKWLAEGDDEFDKDQFETVEGGLLLKAEF